MHSLGIQQVYSMYTSGFIFKGYLYDHPTFTLLKRNIFPIVPVACGCLLGGSTPPWGPDQQYNQLFQVFEGRLCARTMPRGHVSSPNYNSKTLESLADARQRPRRASFDDSETTKFVVFSITPNCFTVYTLTTVTY